MRRSGDAAAVYTGFGRGAVSADVADSRGKFGRRMPRMPGAADGKPGGGFCECCGLRTESRLRE